MRRRHLAAILFLFLAAAAFAEPRISDYEVYLLPITATAAPGAFGSVWSSELWLRRDNAFPAALIAPSLGAVCECPDPVGTLEIDQPFRAGFFSTSPGEPPGGLLYVTTAGREHLHVSLRLRQGANLPVQLPVVPASDFRAATIQLAGIPVRDGARVTLRVYGIDPHVQGDVRIAVVRESPSIPTGAAYETAAPLLVSQRSFDIAGETVPARPAATQIDLTQAIRAVGGESVIVEVTPMTPDLRIWAFASITDNDSQQFVTRVPE